jgi:hypothetical protein
MDAPPKPVIEAMQPPMDAPPKPVIEAMQPPMENGCLC